MMRKKSLRKQHAQYAEYAERIIKCFSFFHLIYIVSDRENSTIYFFSPCYLLIDFLTIAYEDELFCVFFFLKNNKRNTNEMYTLS